MLTIKSNKIQCNQCKDIIESKHVHDYVSCKCGAVAADGGREYLKRTGWPQDYTDLSVIEGEYDAK